MGTLAKIFVLLIVILALGYAAQQKGLIHIKGNYTITKTTSTGTSSVVWTNGNFSAAASDPQSHYKERVSLDVYIFNSFKLKNGAVAYDAYLGAPAQLQQDPYNTAKRILLTYPNSTITSEGCYHLTGYIAGQATVTTMDGTEVHPVYIRASSVSMLGANATAQCPMTAMNG